MNSELTVARVCRLTLLQIGKLKHLPYSLIDGAVGTVCHEQQITLTPDERIEVVAKIQAALELWRR